MADFSSIENIAVGYRPVQVHDEASGPNHRRFELQKVTFKELLGEDSANGIDEVRKTLGDKYQQTKRGIEALGERRDLHPDDLAGISFLSSAYREALDLMDRTYGPPQRP